MTDDIKNDLMKIRRKPRRRFIFVVFVVGYLFLVFFQIAVTGRLAFLNLISAQVFRGVASQFQLLAAVGLVALYKRRGYLVSMALTLTNFMIACIQLIQGNWSVVPGAIMLIGTTIVICVIYFCWTKVERRTLLLYSQNEELRALYKERKTREKTLGERNEELEKVNAKLVEKEHALSKVAYVDSLTNLPNRRKMLKNMDELIKERTETGEHFAFVYIDINDFRKVNDTAGHQVGDYILSEVGKRWRLVLHTKDVLGRFGGDEFAILITRKITKEEIISYLQLFTTVLAEPFVYEKSVFYLTASMGVSVFPVDAETGEELMKNADTAMFRCKANAWEEACFFESDMRQNILRKMDMETNLHDALKNKEFSIAFQPQYFADDRHLRGMEALLRWNSKTLGKVSPYEFIPILEENAEIISVGEWILENACRQMMKYHQELGEKPVLSVNISIVQMRHMGFVKMVKDVLKRTGYDPNYLELELTESVLIYSKETALLVMEQLSDIGVHWAMDDFGTGYSSLSYLQEFPFDVLKIDKTFIDKIGLDVDEKQLVPAIIDLSMRLGLEVVAEGVEDEYQLAFLRDHECSCIQGYLWGKPMFEDEIMSKIKERKAAE